MRKLSLLALSTMFGVFAGNFEMCHAKTKCTPRAFDSTLLIREGCNIKTFFFPKLKEFTQNISNYANFQNAIIIGVKLTDPLDFLKMLGAAGKKQVIWFNELLTIHIGGSLELLSEAVPLAISDFCHENPFTGDYDFMKFV